MNAGVPFYHERSSTLNNAAPKERRAIQMQADADRLRFYEKYGFHTWSPEYAAQFSPEQFGCDSK
jgi:predicted GNAT family N-acyltransferase